MTTFINHQQGASKALVSVILLFVASSSSFFSLLGTGNADDVEYFPHTKNVSSPYFTQSELEALSYINDMGNGTIPFYADYRIVRHGLAMRNIESITAIPVPGIDEIQSGYLYLRVGELERKGVLLTRYGLTGDLYNYRPVSAKDAFREYTTMDNFIYNNTYVEVHLR